MEAEFFHADGRSDMTKLTVAFRNFTNALANDTSDKKNDVGKHEILIQYTKNKMAILRNSVRSVPASISCVANGPTADRTQNPVTVFAILLPGLFFTN
jgi:hypothetical protein